MNGAREIQITGSVPACFTSFSEKLVEISFTPGRLRILTRTSCSGMGPNTRVVYFESPANPNMRLVEIEKAAAIAHQGGAIKAAPVLAGDALPQLLAILINSSLR